jgi:hypothetical protein
MGMDFCVKTSEKGNAKAQSSAVKRKNLKERPENNLAKRKSQAKPTNDEKEIINPITAELETFCSINIGE